MIRRLVFPAALLLLTAGALLFRCCAGGDGLLYRAGLRGSLASRLDTLEDRPMHGDEAVHAFKFRDVWQAGKYEYDPNEFHGPTLYYAALPVVWAARRHDLADTREADFRLVTVLFGAALVPLLALFTDGLGRRATLHAAALLAVSPAFVFYSRYYIQETLLAWFTLAALGCGWRWARTGRAGWLLAAGVASGLMLASKETAVFAFAAAAAALGATSLWMRRVDPTCMDLRRLWQPRLILCAALLGLLGACLFLSGFGSNLRAPIDYLRSYTPWMHRAEGTQLHRQPWTYYLTLLISALRMRGPAWSEAMVALAAVIGVVAALLPARWKLAIAAAAHVPRARGAGGPPDIPSESLARFLAFYSLALLLIYSAIPYKTPWCVLSILEGVYLLAALGVIALLQAAPWRLARAGIVAVVLVACAQLGSQAYRVSYLAYTDAKNPFVYAQPVPDAANLGKKVEELALASPLHNGMVIKVYSIDNYYWPLPWYLRRFPNIGYWNSVPADPDAPVVIASPEFDDTLKQKLPNHLMAGFFGLRPNVFLELWVRMDLWTAHVELLKRTHHGDED